MRLYGFWRSSATWRVGQVPVLDVEDLQPFQNTIVQDYVRETLHADDEAWIQHWVSRGLGLKAVERVVASTAGAFAVGDAVTVLRIDAACAGLAAFQAAHAHAQSDAER